MTPILAEKPIKTGALLAYGCLALPLAFAGLPFYIHAPDFYIRTHGISLATMGTILLFIRLIDALQDPLIGRFSDRFAARRSSILFGALCMLGFGFALLYDPPAALAQPAIWFCGSMVIAAFAFSTITINLNALGSLWSTRSVEKTRITSSREGLGLIGLLLATLTPTLLQLKLTPIVAFHIYAGMFLLLIIVTGLFFLRWVKNHAFVGAPAAASDVPFSYRSFFKLFQAPFNRLFVAYALSMLASSIPGVIVLLFVRERLNAEQLTGLFLAIYFLTGVLGMPMWKKLAERIGKEKSWIAAMLLALSSFVWAYRLGSGDVVVYGVICFLSGLALGAELVLPPSLLSDLIDKSGTTDKTSSIFAILNLISKLALALASGGTLLLLNFFGFVEGQAAPASLQNLSIVYALLPCIIKAAAALVAATMINKNHNIP